jgi:DNA-binding HxlR family transcriptional regulator
MTTRARAGDTITARSETRTAQGETITAPAETVTARDKAMAARSGGSCCPLYHEAVELVGRRWTGAILRVLMDGPLRFSEVSQTIPELSDRLLSERMKELESRGLVKRTVIPGRPLRVRYELSEMGRELEPALTEIETWAQRWLSA